ncbi:hypothetical protein GCM10022394_19080 [Zobellella aerophila]|uniref:Uncharacterized protein n=1 Tax=Zobellella aerophila TaxID=870480 RepID=A0ABP6VQY1_9GAMM
MAEIKRLVFLPEGARGRAMLIGWDTLMAGTMVVRGRVVRRWESKDVQVFLFNAGYGPDGNVGGWAGPGPGYGRR